MFGKLGLAIVALTMIGFSTPALAGGVFDILENHKKRITKNEGDIKDNKGQLVAHGKALKKHDGAIADHEKRITENKNRLDKHDKALGDHEGRIVANTNGVEGNKDAIGKHTEQLDDHENRINGNTGRLDAHDTILDDHEKRITKNAGGVKDNKDAIGNHKTLISDNTGRLDDHDTILGEHDTRITNNANAIQDLNSQTSALRHRVDEAYEGIAMAMAMDAPQVDPGHKFGISARWGTFEGSNAFAGAFKYRIDDNWSAVGGVGVGVDENTFGATAGFEAQW